MSKQKNNGKKWKVRAYCTICHKLLQESAEFTTKELKEKWDTIVFGATAIPCQTCHSKIPNFHIDLKIVDGFKNKEITPKQFFPNPKNGFNQEKIAEEIKARLQYAKEHTPQHSEQETSSEEVSHD